MKTNKKKYRHSDGRACVMKNRWTNEKKDRLTERWTDRPTNKMKG